MDFDGLRGTGRVRVTPLATQVSLEEETMVPEQPGRDSQFEALVAYSRQQAEGSGLVEGSLEGVAPVEVPGYAIVEQIRGGGQGTVFRAVQRTTNREVAIKVLHNGSLGRRADQVRFEREIQALALLQHPRIVRLVDGGAVDGRRFLVMDFIEGESLDEYLREEAPPIRERVALLAKVCDAVAAAHVRGVVHRDLKPSNIRVDNCGEPHVLDFGLARLLETEGHASTMRDATVTGQFLGSPSWASPEQAEGAIGRIDTRTDVYALGLILYHAITGRFPYSVAGSLNDTLNSIRQTVPERPRSSGKNIEIDLETIVLKCLNKEQDRRYQSAGELAAELRRYLAGEPIEARRDSTLYVLSRTLGRHRMITASVAAILVVVVCALAVSLGLLSRAVSAERDVQKRLREVRSLANSFIFGLDEKLQRGTTPTREFYVTTALGYLEGLSNEGSRDPAVLDEVIAAYIKIGDVQGNASYANQGDSLAALQTFEHALALATDGVQRWPGNVGLQRQLANAHERIGDMKCYLAGYTDEDALKSFEECHLIRSQIAGQYPHDGRTLHDLAAIKNRMGFRLLEMKRIPEASAILQESLELRSRWVEIAPENPEARLSLAWGYRRLGDVASAEGRFDVALENLDHALALVDDVLKADPENRSVKRDMLNLSNVIAESTGNSGDYVSMLAQCQRNVALAEELLEEDPSNIQAVTDQHYANQYLGRAYLGLGRLSEAVAQFRRGVSLGEQVAASRVGEKAAWNIVSYAYASLGGALLQAGEIEEAIACLRRSLVERSRLAQDDPTCGKQQQEWAGAMKNLADALMAKCEESRFAMSERRESA